MIKAAGLSSEEDDTWGFDHGSWIPLYLMYPKAEVPVLQVSITKDFDAQKVRSYGMCAFVRCVRVVRSSVSVYALNMHLRASPLRCLRWARRCAPCATRASF